MMTEQRRAFLREQVEQRMRDQSKAAWAAFFSGFRRGFFSFFGVKR